MSTKAITAGNFNNIVINKIKLTKLIKDRKIPFEYDTEIVYQTPYMTIKEIKDSDIPEFLQVTLTLDADYKKFIDKFEDHIIGLIGRALNEQKENWFGVSEDKKVDDKKVKLITLVDGTDDDAYFKIYIRKDPDLFISNQGDPVEYSDLAKGDIIRLIVGHPHLWKKDSKLGLDLIVYKVKVKSVISNPTVSDYQFGDSESEEENPSILAMHATEREREINKKQSKRKEKFVEKKSSKPEPHSKPEPEAKLEKAKPKQKPQKVKPSKANISDGESDSHEDKEIKRQLKNLDRDLDISVSDHEVYSDFE